MFFNPLSFYGCCSLSPQRRVYFIITPQHSLLETRHPCQAENIIRLEGNKRREGYKGLEINPKMSTLVSFYTKSHTTHNNTKYPLKRQAANLVSRIPLRNTYIAVIFLFFRAIYFTLYRSQLLNCSIEAWVIKTGTHL